MLTLSSPVNRTVNMLTRTHAATSLGDADESHVHATVASVIGFLFINEIVASVSLSLVNGTVLN